MPDFLNGQCFNFAYAVCQEIQNIYPHCDLQLATAIGTRTHDKDFDWVCIHCMAGVYSHKKNQAIYVDAQGLHPDSYLEEMAEDWKIVEFEITGIHEDVDIFTYDFCDHRELEMYWHDVEKAGGHKDHAVIEYAQNHIHKNPERFFSKLLQILNNPPGL